MRLPLLASVSLTLGLVWLIAGRAQSEPKVEEKHLEQPKTLKIDLGGGVTLELVHIEPGAFTMGSKDRDRDVEEDEHEVQITKPFYLGKYEVTQEQYQVVTGKNPSYFCREGDGQKFSKAFAEAKISKAELKKFPVEKVSWKEAKAFCDQLTAKDKPGRKYRLPTEAEWEYACRAGTKTPFHFGMELNGEQANCNGDSPYGTTKKGPFLGRTTKVGSYPPNAWGLFDMHGNVAEWCEDDYGSYRGLERKDPFRSPGDRALPRVVRGGSWNNGAKNCRAAFRDRNNPGDTPPFNGFRVACVPGL